MTEKIIEMRRQMDDGNIITLVPHKSESAVKDSDGRSITLTYATKDNLADGSVTKVGVNTVGGANRPIYLLNGVPTVADKVVDTDSAQTLTGNKTFSGLNKFTKRVDLAPVEQFTDIRFYLNNQTVNNMYIRAYDDSYNGTVKAGAAIALRAYNPYSKTQAILGINADGDGNAYGTAPTPKDNAPSTAIVTKANVMSTDGKLNNLVHTIGNETIFGDKILKSPLTFSKGITAEDRNINHLFLYLKDNANQTDFLRMFVNMDGAGNAHLYINLRNADGTTRNYMIA